MSDIRYLPIGDSYTIGEGASEAQAWPTLLTAQLQATGVAITLVDNPARTGWTTQQAIDYELPLIKKYNANFVTVLLGVNDYVQGVSVTMFKQRFGYLLDEIMKTIPADHIVVVTIPDFSVTPTGKLFGNPAESSHGIEEFNTSLTTLAEERHINVVDIFSLSQAAGTDPSLVAPDGLHPSALRYAEWEEVIYPVIHRLLTLY